MQEGSLVICVKYSYGSYLVAGEYKQLLPDILVDEMRTVVGLSIRWGEKV
jgi:hypothetical protein